MRSRRSTLVSVFAAAALVTGAIAAPANAAEPVPDFTATPLTASEPPQEGARSKSGQLAESDAALLGRSDAAVVPIMVKVDVDPVASYAGGLEGFAATSPEVTGKELSLSDPAVKAYLAHVDAVIAETQAKITATVPSAKALSSPSVVTTVEKSTSSGASPVSGVAVASISGSASTLISALSLPLLPSGSVTVSVAV